MNFGSFDSDQKRTAGRIRVSATRLIETFLYVFPKAD
jgi:hypothetical protein